MSGNVRSAGGSLGGAGVKALAVEFPTVVRTNDYYRLGQPEIFESATQRGLARLWSNASEGTSEADRAFGATMEPYLGDVFRGTVERRILSPGEKVLDVELRAAQAALKAAKMSPGDVDLVLGATFISDHIGLGHASFLADRLGTKKSAWNFETACSSSLEALRVATGLVRAGEYRNILLVTSCMYSKVSDDKDTITWFLGDGAAAFVIGEESEGFGVLGAHSLHTGGMAGHVFYEYAEEPNLPPYCIRNSRSAGKVMREGSTSYLEPCVDGALQKAGVTRNDIDFWVFNTPTAWFEKFATRTLGVDPAKTISTYAEFGNVGTVLMPANLHRAAQEGKIKKGDLVCAYSIGSVASAGAVVMRWGDVSLGPPTPPGTVRQ